MVLCPACIRYFKLWERQRNQVEGQVRVKGRKRSAERLSVHACEYTGVPTDAVLEELRYKI